MYEVRLIDQNHIVRRVFPFHNYPSLIELRELADPYPEFFIDICRIPFNPLTDTANFRDHVDYDIEPFDEEFV